MKKAEKTNDSPRRPTPDEYRAVRRRVQRETTRVVRRTLLGIALFAGLYYLFLTSTSRRVATPPEPDAPNAVEPENAVESDAPTT